MSKKNLLSGRDKELQELAEQYEAAKAENKPIYLDADDLADLADWYAMHGKSEQATEVVAYTPTVPLYWWNRPISSWMPRTESKPNW